jgi:transcriptional regulator with XRE-family HTH domain
MTQEELAGALGVSPQSVSNWERGDCYPDTELMPRIATYFDVTMDELFGMEAFRD